MFQKMEQVAIEALAKNPADISARICLGELLVARGEYEQAFQHFNEALQAEPQNVRLLTSIARACRDLGEDETALKLLSYIGGPGESNLVVQHMQKSLGRVDELFRELGHLGSILASDRSDTLGKEAAPFLVDLNGDLLRLPVDLLRYLWHTYHSDREAIVPRLDAETGHYHYIQRTLKPGETVLDVGANIGIFSTMMARAVAPSGWVHAFEPSPKIAGDLERVLRLNEIENVVLNRCAVSDSAGTVRFADIQEKDVRRESSYIDMTGINRISDSFERTWIEVPTITIDRYVTEKGLQPALVKIDVEGADMLALKGGESTFRQFHPPIVLEVHPQVQVSPDKFVSEVQSFLTGLGYRFQIEDKIYYCVHQ